MKMQAQRKNTFFRRIASAFRAPSRHERETAYLNRSVSMCDLERRQREIAAGKFRFY
jgi:Protein of unknown function (DUF3563)